MRRADSVHVAGEMKVDIFHGDDLGVAAAAAPPFMPKHGPSDGSRTQMAAFLPIRFSPSPRPTVVVVLPSPAGVGVIAVTRISLPRGRSEISSRNP